ncbi:MAG: bacteriohemerythrin [Candidatus Zixiibacteriota bacterium]
MVYFQWDETYSVGVDSIDNQHKKLVGMIASLQRAFVAGRHEAEMGNVLRALVDYTRYHFSEEEALMKRIGFEELARHMELHHQLVEQIVDILKQLRAGKPYNAPDLIEFLKHWLIDHIMAEDKKVAVVYQNQLKRAMSPVSDPAR